MLIYLQSKYDLLFFKVRSIVFLDHLSLVLTLRHCQARSYARSAYAGNSAHLPSLSCRRVGRTFPGAAKPARKITAFSLLIEQLTSGALSDRALLFSESRRSQFTSYMTP